MQTAELLELFRLETDDIAEPYLWSDSEFYTYLNDAQDFFVRRTGGILDSSSAITRIPFFENDTLVKYDQRILHIKSAADDFNRKITVYNIDNFEDGRILSDDYGNMTNAGLDDGRTGPLRYIITDMEADKLRLYPLPDKDGYMRLYVSRRPLLPITDENSKLEIPEYHRLGLLDGVKRKAFMKQDVETFDKSKAREFHDSFLSFIDDANKDRSARLDRKRSMQYGGVPMV